MRRRSRALHEISTVLVAVLIDPRKPPRAAFPQTIQPLHKLGVVQFRQRILTRPSRHRRERTHAQRFPSPRAMTRRLSRTLGVVRVSLQRAPGVRARARAARETKPTPERLRSLLPRSLHLVRDVSMMSIHRRPQVFHVEHIRPVPVRLRRRRRLAAARPSVLASSHRPPPPLSSSSTPSLVTKTSRASLFTVRRRFPSSLARRLSRPRLSRLISPFGPSRSRSVRRSHRFVADRSRRSTRARRRRRRRRVPNGRASTSSASTGETRRRRGCRDACARGGVLIDGS